MVANSGRTDIGIPRYSIWCSEHAHCSSAPFKDGLSAVPLAEPRPSELAVNGYQLVKKPDVDIGSDEPGRIKYGDAEFGVSKDWIGVNVASVHGKGLDGHGLTGLRGWWRQVRS